MLEGAPGKKMKMQFLAVLRRVTADAVGTVLEPMQTHQREPAILAAQLFVKVVSPRRNLRFVVLRKVLLHESSILFTTFYE